MITELLKKFSGAQLTAIVLALIFTPAAVGAAVSFQPVAIVDPSTGKQSYVDNGRKLWTYDPVAGYRNNPYNFFQMSVNPVFADNTLHVIYTVPTGKALILTAVNISHYHGIAGNDNFLYVMTQNYGRYIAGFDDVNAAGTHTIDLGTGYYLHSGDRLQYLGGNGSNSTMGAIMSLTGYLVPDNTLPPVTAQVAAEQDVVVGEGVPPRKTGR